VLVHSGVKGTRITATNRMAEKAGAVIGQMLNDARAACPEIHVEQGNEEADRDYLTRLGHWGMRYSPMVAIDGIDGLLVDIAGCDHLFGGEQALITDFMLRVEAIGLSARAGLADTPGAAWALARYGRGQDLIAPPNQSLEATIDLPIEAMRLEEKVLLLLRRLGLKQIDQLHTIPRAALERRFRSREAASSVQLRLDQLVGFIREPLVPLKEVAPYREVLSCAEPAIEAAAIAMALDHLLLRLEHRLECEGLGARALTLTACHSDGGYDGVSIVLGRAAREPDYIARLFSERLEGINPGFGIDLFILSADRVEKMSEAQQSLAANSLPKDVIPLIDRLMNRLGVEHITRLAPVASHVPERAQRSVPAIGGQVMGGQAPAWEIMVSRPFRLFERPELIETIAEVPDGPPLRFVWRRLTRKIIRSRGPERIAPEWWREIGNGGQGSYDNRQSLLLRTNARDYYEVEDEEGTRYWLFRAGLYGLTRNGDAPQWFIHGLFG